MNDKIARRVLTANVITIAIFTFLAIESNHWWIVLFAVLFLSHCETKD